MENRFKILREEVTEERKNKNPKAKIYTTDDLSKDFSDLGYNISSPKIRKIETDTYGVKIDPKVLLAYKTRFNVSIDWLVDPYVNTRYLSGDIHNASKVTNLSEVAIRKIKSYPVKSQNILNLIIENSSIEHIIKSIYAYIPDGFNAENRKIIENVEYKFYRFLATQELQSFLDEVISDKRIFDFLYDGYEKNMLEKIAEYIYKDNPESYNKLLKAGNRYGLNFLSKENKPN